MTKVCVESGPRGEVNAQGPTAHLPATWYLSLVRDGQLFAPYDLAVSTACLHPPQGNQGDQRSTQNNVQREKSLPECFPALSFHQPSAMHTSC